MKAFEAFRRLFHPPPLVQRLEREREWLEYEIQRTRAALESNQARLRKLETECEAVCSALRALV